ncbi:helix-turn-helix domain-containing protein [Streptomyces naphthomycinicus]|uniref:helix-turn-helix domain-containing protein n=1 Tax=Streptomyces naphthomycinicus TaxID=2872625 RepID=UPI001CEC61D7|nr:helix-turn-helix transcriptional regulator [Streptomyces sp. TML10]
MSVRGDVEEFAALLRRLKDRTGRSYGSLARRLAMNTSTLHRYCAGEAVPQDFAPVERLAAFCEATPQERLELHRLWLSAVAARQRAHRAGPPQATAPEAEEEAEADGVCVEEGGSARQAGDDPAPDTPAPSPASPSAPPASPPASRRWYRRRRVVASAAVTCALLATVGITSALSDDHSFGADASRAAGPRSTAPGTPRRSATPSAGPSPAASPSPARSRSSASPGPRHQAPAPSVTGSGPSAAAQPAGGLPLSWSADSQVWDMGCGHDYVIDKSPARVPPPPVQQDAGAWAVTQGALHGRQTMVRISVQGRSSTAVVLESLRVRVVSRGNPAAGNAYAMDQGCGGELTPRRFTVNLDADRPIARPEDGADSEHTIPAVHFPYRVSAEDPEVLLVDATTQTHDARWYLELDWSCQGRTGTIRIDDHGRPFHTTGITKLPRYWYGTNDAGERAWVPYGG